MSDETVSRPTDPHLEHRGPLPAGTPAHVGKYEVLRVLGAGAFGRVYLGFDPKIRRYVAVKMPLLPPESSDAFLREARVLADVHNENICPIYDADAHNDIPFIAMRYVSGGTLGGWLKGTQPTVNQALRFAEQIARGLDAAHAKGIVHRDLKPDNILYDRDADQLLLTDFGLAKWTGSVAATTGGAKGTPAYMAPEQCSPDRFGPVSARSDVYALGVILFRMLTGEPLFTVPPGAEGWGLILAMMAKHTDAAPRAPSAVCRAVSPRLDAVCLKALAKQPADRYESAKAFAAAVADYLRPAPTVPPPPISPPPVPVPTKINCPGCAAKLKSGRGFPVGRQVNCPNCGTAFVVGAVLNVREQPRPAPAPAPTQQTTWRIDVPGAWYSRPAEDANAEWTKVAETPTEITTRPGEVYKLAPSEGVTDNDLAGLAHLKGLNALRSLHLSDSEVTDAGFAHLQHLTSLQELSLFQCTRLTDAGLAHLQNLPALQDLNLFLLGADAGLTYLTSLTALRSLDLSWCVGCDADLAHLQNLTALQHLNLSSCNFTDAGLARLQNLSALQRLDLSSCERLTDASLARLKPLTALRHLKLSGCRQITDAGLAYLKSLPALRHLDLSQCEQFTDAGLAHLKSLSALQELELWRVTDAGLAHLKSLTSLRSLKLSWCEHTDAGFAHLKNLTALRHLELFSCGVADAGLTHLKNLPALRCLTLWMCYRVTDAALAHLKSLPALQHLELHLCDHVTDAGLEHLQNLNALQHLRLHRCSQITGAGVATLKAVLPSCEIIHHQY